MITERDITRAMEYTHSSTAETFTLAGYTVEISHDQDADSPYDAWEGNSPAIWMSLRGGFTEYGGASLESFFDRVSAAWVSRNWRAICRALDVSESSHDVQARDIARSGKRYGQSLSDARCDAFIDALHDMRSDSWGSAIDYLETLRALYRMAGVPAETFERNGYCQGDSVYGLIVMTPEWAETVGASHAKGKPDMAACERDMASQADVYGGWVWGDVYGFSITGPGTDAEDSCFGFYGSDPIASGIAEAIAESINAATRNVQKTRRESLKTWIRNRVPLHVRAANLDSFPA